MLKERKKELKGMEEEGIFKDCKDCQGTGTVAVTTGLGTYGWRQGDDGWKECPKCKGKGYTRRVKVEH